MPEPLLHPLREEARRLFSGVRRDRGAGLYLAKERRAFSDAECPAWLHAEERSDGWLALMPTDTGLRVLENWLMKRAATEETYLRFRERAFSPLDTALLFEGLKKMEAGASQGEISAYRMAVAARAAVLLRKKCELEGGGLYICALMIHVMEETLADGRAVRGRS